MNDYFSSVFNWLFECEQIFGFDLEGYGQKRLYAFWLKDISHFGLKNTQNLKLGQFSFTIQIRIE